MCVLWEKGRVIRGYRRLDSCCHERQCTSCFFCDAGFGPIAQYRFWIDETYIYIYFVLRFNRCALMVVITWFPSLNVQKYAHSHSGRRKDTYRTLSCVQKLLNLTLRLNTLRKEV